MKVAIIEPVGGHGGMNYYDQSLSLGLDKLGCSVFWYTCDKTKEDGEGGVSIIKSFRGVYGDVNIYFRGFLFIVGLVYSLVDAKIKRCDVLHYHFFHFGAIEALMVVLARLFFFPVVLTVHDVSSFAGSSSSFFESLVYRLVGLFVVHNNVSKRELAARSKREDDIRVIPHGDYSSYVMVKDQGECKKELGLDLRAINFLFFGQIKKVKGLDVFLEALVILKRKGVGGFTVTVAGKEWKDSFGKYRDYIAENNLSENLVSHIRYIRDDEVDIYYGAADVVVLPYRKIYQSGVLLMALSYGKPVIVSDLEGMTEVVVDGISGLVFGNGNAECLASKMEYLLDNPSVLRKLATAGKEELNLRFCWGRISLMTLDAYREALH